MRSRASFTLSNDMALKAAIIPHTFVFDGRFYVGSTGIAVINTQM
jgi:hypothetical protein